MPITPDNRDAIMILRGEHRQIEALFRRCAKQLGGEQPVAELRALAEQALDALALHAEVEEELFYPAMRQALGERSPLVVQYVEEHRVMRTLMADLRASEKVDDLFNARLVVLMELIRHHIRDEEEYLFPPCREVCGRRLMREIGGAMMDFRKRLERRVPVQPATALDARLADF